MVYIYMYIYISDSIYCMHYVYLHDLWGSSLSWLSSFSRYKTSCRSVCAISNTYIYIYEIYVYITIMCIYTYIYIYTSIYI